MEGRERIFVAAAPPDAFGDLSALLLVGGPERSPRSTPPQQQVPWCEAFTVPFATVSSAPAI